MAVPTDERGCPRVVRTSEGKLMKIVATTLLALALALVPVAGQAGQADGGGARKKRLHVGAHRQHFAASTYRYRNPMAANDYNGYYENILDKAPFGSKVWWRVYNSYPKGR